MLLRSVVVACTEAMKVCRGPVTNRYCARPLRETIRKRRSLPPYIRLLRRLRSATPPVEVRLEALHEAQRRRVVLAREAGDQPCPRWTRFRSVRRRAAPRRHEVLEGRDPVVAAAAQHALDRDVVVGDPPGAGADGLERGLDLERKVGGVLVRFLEDLAVAHDLLDVALADPVLRFGADVVRCRAPGQRDVLVEEPREDPPALPDRPRRGARRRRRSAGPRSGAAARGSRWRRRGGACTSACSLGRAGSAAACWPSPPARGWRPRRGRAGTRAPPAPGSAGRASSWGRRGSRSFNAPPARRGPGTGGRRPPCAAPERTGCRRGGRTGTARAGTPPRRAGCASYSAPFFAVRSTKRPSCTPTSHALPSRVELELPGVEPPVVGEPLVLDPQALGLLVGEGVRDEVLDPHRLRLQVTVDVEHVEIVRSIVEGVDRVELLGVRWQHLPQLADVSRGQVGTPARHRPPGEQPQVLLAECGVLPRLGQEGRLVHHHAPPQGVEAVVHVGADVHVREPGRVAVGRHGRDVVDGLRPLVRRQRPAPGRGVERDLVALVLGVVVEGPDRVDRRELDEDSSLPSLRGYRPGRSRSSSAK